MANEESHTPPGTENEAAMASLLRDSTKTLLNLLLAQFLMDPPKVLSLIETANPSDCDTSPSFINLQLSPGQTLVLSASSPPGQVGVNTKGVIFCDTPEAISASFSMDGKLRGVMPSGPALAGRYEFDFWGYDECSVLTLTITNSHIGTVGISIIGYGAYISRTIWEDIKAKITYVRNQLFVK